MTCSGNTEPKRSEPSSTERPRCQCGHFRTNHQQAKGQCIILRCECQGFLCDHSGCGWKPREEKSSQCGYCDAGLPMACTCPPEECVCDSPEEPPMTPEEEEQAPLDGHCIHENGCRYLLTNDCEHGCRAAADELTQLGQDMEAPPPCTCSSRMETDDGNLIHDEGCDALKEPWPCGDCGAMVPAGEDWCTAPDCQEKAPPPPERPECTPCVCGHIEPEHSRELTRHCLECDCREYDMQPRREPPPPQPDKRPPYAVAYSVQGHLYEVALSGDATVQAMDGALVITHHLGPIAGIVQTRPIVNEESNA